MSTSSSALHIRRLRPPIQNSILTAKRQLDCGCRAFSTNGPFTKATSLVAAKRLHLSQNLVPFASFAPVRDTALGFRLLSEPHQRKMHLVFPPISPFLELVQHAHQIPDKIIVRDHYSGRTATAGQLLQHVALLREKVQATLQQNGTANGTSNGDNAKESKFYYLIAPPGLEYVVSMLTIFSLGGVMSAQCKQSLPWR